MGAPLDMRPHDPVAVAGPEATTITSLFRAQVVRAPQATALESREQSLSYAELDARSGSLARRLVAAGVRRGDLVGIRGIRRAETVVGLLGILKAGAAYLPLNPSDPSERLRRILEDAAPVAVVEPENRGHTDLPFAGPVLGVPGCDDDSGVALSVDAADLTGEDLAYVCYTSGSTGQPKGVMIPHRGVTRLVRNTNYIDIRPEDVFLQFAPLSFDASTFEIWGALLNGAKLVIYPSEGLELGVLARFIAEQQVSALFLTTALFNLMVDWEPGCLLRVRWVLMGGEAVSVPHVRKILPRMGAGCSLVHCYGPTENTTFTTCHRMDCSTVLADRIPIGVPISGTQVVILGSDGYPAPIGAAGEILIGGSGLAAGYLNSATLDAEKFVEIADLPVSGGRFYRSGDLGAWNDDGTIDFRGRLDEQVKIRGFRIELGEIEAALRQIPGVRDAAVALRMHGAGEKTLAAFVVGADLDASDSATFKAKLGRRVPDYMVPAELHFVADLPVNSHGKVDKGTLLQKFGEAETKLGGALAGPVPRDLLEHKLAAIWSRLFRNGHIRRDDNFFELGGHSLLAAQLAHEVEKLVGRQFPIAFVFQAQTIAELAAAIEAEDWAPVWSSLVPLRPEGVKAPLFLLHGHGGHVYVYLDLARALDCERPIYGVQALGADGREQRHETVEQMAAHYAREIRSLQPEGPYHLAGFSMGGWIAYAVAQEMRRAGQEVAFLGLFDTHATANVPWYHRWLSIFSARDPLRTAWHYLIRFRRTTTGYYNLRHALYRPPIYGGSGDVFVARKKTGFFFRIFWRQMLRGGVRFHTVPGSHDDMLSPVNCPALAGKLESVLQSSSSREKDADTHLDLNVSVQTAPCQGGTVRRRKRSAGEGSGASRHRLEKELCEIWQVVLGRRHTGLHENFFELGGDSLSAAVCCATISRKTGLEIPVRLLFDNPTIAGLAGKLVGVVPGFEPMSPADRHGLLPASCGQESLWFVQQILPDAAAYNEPVAWRFAGHVDTDRLRASFSELMVRHEILRTALVYDEGRLCQRIHHPEEVELPWRAMACTPGCRLDEIMRDESRRPFRLDRAPLWRALWIEETAGTRTLQLTFHHGIIDEWSVRLLAAEVGKLYAGETLDPLPLQYADFAAWQRRDQSGRGADMSRSYWRGQLARLPSLSGLTSDVDPPLQRTGRGAKKTFRIAAEVAAKLRSLAHEEGATVFVVMLAAFQSWLHGCSGANDVVVGTPFAQRTRPETQTMAGYFLNMMPIRTRFSEGENFRALVRRVQETVLAAFEHSDLPFSSIVELTASGRGSRDRSLFRVMFALLERGVPLIRLGDVSSRGGYLYNTDTAKCDLTLFVNAEGQNWDCCLEYSADLFSQADATRMAREMAHLFGTLAGDPSLDLRRLRIGQAALDPATALC